MTRLKLALEKVDFPPLGRVTDDTSILTLKNLVFEPLCRWRDGFASPGLFAHWDHSPDGRMWRFYIRAGATFHDGKPCDAQDILDFITGILGAVDTFGMKWSYARYLADARFTIAARDCLLVENPQPIADIVDIFSEFFIARAALDGSATIGTGPYRVIDFQPKISVDLERVGEGSGPARIAAQACVEADDRYDLLVEGEVDVAMNLERMDRRMDGDARFRWGRATNTLSVIYYLNCSKGLFASPQARLAVNHAVDVQRIIDKLFQGLGLRASTIVSPFHLGFAEANIAPIAYDPVRAKALFDAAGVEGEITIRTPRTMPERAMEISRMVQQDLAAVGVAARLDIEPDRPDYARQIGRKEMGDMAIFDSSPHSTYRVLNDKISSGVKGVWWQGFDDPELERMIEAANRTVGDRQRATAYGQCLRHLNANPPWLYLFHPIEIFAADKTIDGIGLDHKGVLSL